MNHTTVHTTSRRWASLASALVLVGLLLPACASTSGDTSPEDPWEDFNRGIWWFNMQVDEYALEPTAKGWTAITNEPVRESVGRFFTNLKFPASFVSNLLQAKFADTGTETARFVINTTVGILGFFDPATDWGIEAKREDIGEAFGAWGIGTGPYLVVPFLGPSDPRDLVGVVADDLVYPDFYSEEILVRAFDVVNDRALDMQRINDWKEEAFDFYIFVRDAYLQNREAKVDDFEDEDDDPGTDADLYGDELYGDDLYGDPDDEGLQDDPEGRE